MHQWECICCHILANGCIYSILIIMMNSLIHVRESNQWVNKSYKIYFWTSKNHRRSDIHPAHTVGWMLQLVAVALDAFSYSKQKRKEIAILQTKLNTSIQLLPTFIDFSSISGVQIHVLLWETSSFLGMGLQMLIACSYLHYARLKTSWDEFSFTVTCCNRG